MEEGTGYSWTDQYKRSWDVIQEDDHGTLAVREATQISSDLAEMFELRRKWIEKSNGAQRGILRHIYVVVDMSRAMGEKEFKPSYLEVTCQHLKQFVVEFYDQNPISLIGFIITKDGVAQKISELSGNPLQHQDVLHGLMDSSMIKGEPSLINALELAKISLSSKEIIVIMTSLTSRDPGDITKTIEGLKADSIATSFISLTAEVFVSKKIADETGGTYRVALHEDHLKTLLWDKIPPPVISSSSKSSSFLVLMGFPSIISLQSLCACHNKITTLGYECPQCHSKQCYLPTDCTICGLKLISAPHLARSYHHLFPILPYVETYFDDGSQSRCFACANILSTRTVDISTSSTKDQHSKVPSINDYQRKMVGYVCRKCKRPFCLSCDIFIHDTLHTCPGCL